MKLAVLGTDADLLSLVAAARIAGHEVVWLGDVRPVDAVAIGKLLPGLSMSADWESLLDHGLVDAVLVGRGTAKDDLKAEQLKRLVTDAVPTLIVHPAILSVLTFYELDMGRRESHAVVRHYNPLVGNPILAELADWVRSDLGGTPRAGHPATGPAGCRVGDGRGVEGRSLPRPSPEAPGRATRLSEIGAVHQVVCQRFTTDCGRDAVMRHLARDVELLRAVVGDVRSVSAVGPRVAESTYASLQVQLTGGGAATVRWSVVPTPGQSSLAELTLIGERGTVTLRIPEAREPDVAAERASKVMLETDVGGNRESHVVAPWDAPPAAIDALAAALPANGTDQSAAASTWQDATVAMEIADAIELSLQKGRTIEVHPQHLTEQLAFRGTMAAFGCGLLLVGLFVLVVAGVLGDALNIPLMRYWPWALLAVLGVFLLLQVVPWLAGKKN